MPPVPQPKLAGRTLLAALVTALLPCLAMPAATARAAEAPAGAPHVRPGPVVHVEQGWARFSPIPGRPGAAYFTLHGAATADRLTAVTTPIAGRAELHQHVMENGVMRMGRVAAIAVPAGGTVVLKPGGLHVMLFDLKSTPKPGEAFPMTLAFEKSGMQPIMVTAAALTQTTPPAAGGQHGHAGHDHH